MARLDLGLRAALAALVTVGAVGCGGTADPCDGVTGSICITARVEAAPGATVTGLDQLRVTVDKLPGEMALSPTMPAAFSLPVKLALVLPETVTGQITVTVVGLAGGQVQATAPPQTVTVNPPAKASLDFHLSPTSGPMGDMQMPPPPDLSQPDMAQLPGTGTMVLSDLVGTVYALDPSSMPQTYLQSHQLFTSAAFPALAGAPQYADADATVTHGCTANRYNTTADFNADENVGLATFSGINTELIATERGGMMAGPPVGSTLSCSLDSMLNIYVCHYDANSPAVINGLTTAQTFYPPIAATPCPPTATPFPTGCEQHPFTPTTVISFNLAGGGDYGPASGMVQPPVAPMLLSVNGMNAMTAATPMELFTLPAAQPATISWTCTAGSTTPGQGCSPGTIVALFVQTSTNTRDRFAVALPRGEAQCVEFANVGTITLQPGAIQTLRGNQGAAMGSYLVGLSQFGLDFQMAGPRSATFAAGYGYVGYVNF